MRHILSALKWSLLGLLLLLVSIYAWHWVDRGEVSAQEQLHADEDEQIAQALGNFERLLENYKTTRMARGAHAKAHACVRASFEVADAIDPALRHGVFHTPGHRYKSWIRFSNGHFDLRNSQDSKEDARGLAIKLLEPPGAPLQVAANRIPTQDFLLTNSPVFFARDIAAYNALVANPEAFFDWFFPALWNPWGWRLRELQAAKRVLTPTPKSLLGQDYFSITPYRLGPHNIKYIARPCSEPKVEAGLVGEEVADGYLRRKLQETLAHGDACFVFMVQKQDIGKNMPLEDPTVEWLEEDSPYLEVARLAIPSQDFAEAGRDEFCEQLSFAPWHALPAHRPLGQFNRMRRAVYPGSSNFRHARNSTILPESLDW